MSLPLEERRRETVVYHHVEEETPLVTTSPIVTLHNPTSEHALVAKQQRIYSAITLADIFQKVVYTTIITSFVLYSFTYLGCEYEDSLLVYFIFSICSWVTAATVNLFAEYFISRRAAIIFGFILYFIGVATLTGLSCHMMEGADIIRYVAIIPLYFICIGEGLCKTFIGDFGYDQFSETRLSESLKTYTSKLYWIGHTGALFLIAFLLGIVQFANYEIGFGLCCVCLGAGFMSFCIGWKKFRKPDRRKVNALTHLCSIISEARSVRKSFLIRSRSSGIFHESLGRKANVQHWMDYAKLKFGGSYSESDVQEAKSFFKMAAIFMSFIPYWVCNAQGYSTFIYQGFHLNTAIGSIAVPVSWISLVNIVAVLFFVKLLERIVYPALRRNGYSFPTTWRIVIGMLAACVSMVLAGSIQLYAQHATTDYGTSLQQIGKINMTYVPSVHILWTVPQYVFLGISEVLVGLTGLGLACKLCPVVFQKVVTSLYYVMVAMGNIISLVIFSIGWFPRERYLHGYEMVIYFFSIAGFGLLGIFLFIIVVSRQDSSSKQTASRTEGRPHMEEDVNLS